MTDDPVDVVGLSILSGAHMSLFPRVRKELEERGMGHVLLTGGGIISADDMAARLLAGIGGRDLHRSRPAFHCPCGQERAAQTVRLLEAREVGELQARGETLEIRCEFCGDQYRVAPEELTRLRGAQIPEA